jgi:hypothetical protein
MRTTNIWKKFFLFQQQTDQILRQKFLNKISKAEKSIDLQNLIEVSTIA